MSAVERLQELATRWRKPEETYSHNELADDLERVLAVFEETACLEDLHYRDCGGAPYCDCHKSYRPLHGLEKAIQRATEEGE